MGLSAQRLSMPHAQLWRQPCTVVLVENFLISEACFSFLQCSVNEPRRVTVPPPAGATRVWWRVRELYVAGLTYWKRLWSVPDHWEELTLKYLDLLRRQKREMVLKQYLCGNLPVVCIWCLVHSSSHLTGREPFMPHTANSYNLLKSPTLLEYTAAKSWVPTPLKILNSFLIALQVNNNHSLI